jgi:F-type H+-transporting ATPase subunit gamma
MPSLKDIRNRISSVKNTQKITRAMKLVAASKLRRAYEAIEAARPYAKKIGEVVSVLAGAVEADAHPLLRSKGEAEKVLVLVLTSDRGLCGPFNTNLMRQVERFVKQSEGVQTELAVIGKKGNAYFGRRGYTIASKHPEVLAKGVTAGVAAEFTALLIERFMSGDYDRVYLAYNEFKSAIVQEQRIEQLLPVVATTGGGDGAVEGSGEGQGLEFLFEPDKDALLNVLLPKYVQAAVLRAMLDSMASEQGSRMSAMDSATKNASEMINTLTLTYNRARQAAITRELVEITTGAQALEG